MKKIVMSILGIVLVFTGIFFVGCGKKDYSSLNLTCDETNIVMDIGQTRNISFTIENYFSGMTGKLNLTKSGDTNALSLEQSSPRKGVTTVTLEALSGGVVSLRAVTVEGHKECLVNVTIRQYSQNLTGSDERLFASNSSPFTPSASHFVFDDFTTEKNLRYFFYGTVGTGIESFKLSLSDVKGENGDFINEFSSVRLVKASAVENTNYMVFIDSEGNEFTLANITPAVNVLYRFSPLRKDEEGNYDFTNAYAVPAGSRYTFLAYNFDSVFTQRDFYVMPDIVSEDITFSYNYVYRDVNSNQILGQYPVSGNADKVVLVPNRQENQPNTDVFVDYGTVRLKLNMPEKSEDIKIAYGMEDKLLANAERISGNNEYVFEINNKSSLEAVTNLKLNIYYDGFENSSDPSVNYVLNIPVQIKFEPKTILVNNSSSSYTFYNNYSGDYGWQDFQLFVGPDTSSFNNIEVIYNPEEVRVRYNGDTYKGDENLITLQDGKKYNYVTITDISKPLQIKGINGKQEVEEGYVYFRLNYNMLETEEDSRVLDNGYIKYRVIDGAATFDFNEDDEKIKAEYNHGVYVSDSSKEELFNLLYADAPFSNIGFRLKEGENVVNLEFVKYEELNGKFIAQIKIYPRENSKNKWGTYILRLDNGLAREVTFRVIETLEGISINYGSNSTAITKLENNATSANIYMLLDEREANGNLKRSNASFELYTNGQRNSTAMIVEDTFDASPSRNFSYVPSVRTVFDAGRNEIGHYLDISLSSNMDGNGRIEFTVAGYKIENFRRVKENRNFNVYVTTYSLINNLIVYKDADGKGNYQDDGQPSSTLAHYVYVYKGTSLEEPRTARFTLTSRYPGYLFQRPAHTEITEWADEDSEFDGEYVYWTAPGITIRENTIDGIRERERMIYGGIYEIGEYGTFNTQTLTFVASSEEDRFNDFTIIAHVRQHERTYSFAITFKPQKYIAITDLTVNSVENLESNKLNFSIASNKRTKSFTISSSPIGATRSTIKAIFKPNTETEAFIFGQNDEGIRLNRVDDATWLLSLDCSPFIENFPELTNSKEALSGTLIIAAADWLDANNNVKSEYLGKIKSFEVNFENGTEKNPIHLETAQDVLSMKSALSSFYEISTSIDLSSVEKELPLGKFEGTLRGTNNYAEITGVNVGENTKDEANNYGLFSEVAEGALIEHVKFSGCINLASVESGANIGLVTAVNNGTLKNLGVSIVANSDISLIGEANIGFVAGVNNGSIEQDFTTYTKSVKVDRLDAEGNVVKDQDGNIIQDETWPYNGLRSNILVYMDRGLSLNVKVGEDNFDTKVAVGGVTGLNKGKIFKVDNPDMNLYGYSQYLAYVNITMFRYANNDFPNNTFTNKYVGGVAGLSEANSQIYGTGYGKIYSYGDGILVGGRLEGPNYVGGVVGKFEGTTGGSHKFREEGLTEDSIYLEFNGMTSRAFIVGQDQNGSTTLTVGAIAGALYTNFQSGILPDFAVQAIDDVRRGLDASMIKVYVGNTSVLSSNINDAVIAFGTGEGNDVSDWLDGRVVHYIERELKRPEMGNSFVIVDNISVDTYYGNYVFITEDNGDLKANFVQNGGDKQYFTKDKNSWYVKNNITNGFKSFEKEDTSLNQHSQTDQDKNSSEILYAYYFQASAFVAGSGDITDVQNELNKLLNTVSTSDKLYPLMASNGLTFKSLNPEIIIFNQMGTLTTHGTGMARVEASSLLNEKDKLVVNIMVVNYFNSSEEFSIVYPDMADDSSPINSNETRIELRGTNTVTLYIKPNYSFEDQSLGININDLGVVNIRNGATIRLSPNTTLTFDYKQTDFSPLDSENEILDERELLEININGQELNISKKNAEDSVGGSKEGTYYYQITTRLEANIAVQGQDNKLQKYVCYVNKKIENTRVIYTKGAENIYTEQWDELAISTSKKGEDFVVVDSPSEEKKPKYIIYKLGKDINGYEVLGDILQGTYELKEGYPVAEKESLFTVDFEKLTTSTGQQRFRFTVEVNKDSKAYKEKHLDNIYGDYEIHIHAESDLSKYVSVKLHLVNMNLSNITIDNYSDIKDLEKSNNFSITSEKAIPGKTGLLAINVTPEDADFDYIEIVNSALAANEGNGRAGFNLVARRQNPQTSSNGLLKLFDEITIAGSAIENGLRIYQTDLINFYNSMETTSEGEVNKYLPYNGLIYVNYQISSLGVADGSLSEFVVTAYKNGKVIYKPQVKTLINELKYHAYITLDGKAPIEGESEEGIITNSYYVARGLRYKLNLDYYGFDLDHINITTSQPDKATVSFENGEYYLNITSDPFDYTIDESGKGYSILIDVKAEQEVGEEVRQASSTTRVRVMEYVLEYNYKQGEQYRDIVQNMGQGVINVQIGSKQTLRLDLAELVEFDQTNETVVSEVEDFIDRMTSSGAWTVYTNLNSSGVSMGGSVTTQEKTASKPKGYQTKYTLSDNKNFELLYFKTRGLDVTPIVTHDYLDSYYVFSFDTRYEIQDNKGVYIKSIEDDAPRIYTEFRFNVYQSSSEESPIPVNNYEELMSMQSGAYYILMKDVVINNDDFQPINTNIASFDGNGYIIFFNGIYNFNSTEIGLFGTVNEGTVIKNLTIGLSGDTIFAISSEGFRLGLVAGQNYGNITNCYVFSQKLGFSNSKYSLSIENSFLNADSYVAGLVGENGGNVTNCRSSVDITSSFNIGGLVGTNNGKIASSYFKEGKLVGTSQATHKMGGLVVNNSESGQIITSYVSGSQLGAYVLSLDTSNYISSTTPVGGLAYSNLGTIKDCYSNIKIVGSSTMAGFVYENGGTIKNCFSLSVLLDNRISSAGFSMSNSYENETGVFEDCYYIIHTSTGANDLVGNINTSLAALNFEGVKALDIDDFSKEKLQTYFDKYAYSGQITNDAVWYYSSGRLSDIFDNRQFNSGRLELVAPNIIAFSQKELLNSIVDETTGDILYVYGETVGSEKLGSIKNPYLIDSPQSLETHIKEPSSRAGINFENYRLISDIDYTDYDNTSELYNITLAGSLEGNGMEISGITLLSQKAMPNAGLFAQIGRDVMNTGSVMNLTINPREVNFTNSQCVGAIAGTLSYGYIYNVTVETDEELVVLGKNLVGGLIGRAINNYAIKNVTSNLSAVSTFKPNYTATSTTQQQDDDILHSYNQSQSPTEYSYAGALIGFAGGTGKLEWSKAESVYNVMGDRIGVALGGIGSNATVNYLFVDLISEIALKPYRYAAFAVGEVKGSLNYVKVSKATESQIMPFKLEPEVPISVGGIVGLLNRGQINEAYMGQGFEVDSRIVDNISQNISHTGGIAGRSVGDSRISKSVVDGNIKAASTLGGAVGYVKGALRMEETAVKSNKLHMRGAIKSAILGGLIGSAEGNASVITNSYTSADLTVESWVYGQDIDCNIGSFIGNGSPYKMSYCYATGKLSVTMEDLRQVSGLEDQVSKEELVSPIEYQKVHSASSQIDHVYYYGFDVEEEKVESLKNYAGMIDFYTRKFNNGIVLKENVLGTASYNFAAKFNMTELTSKTVLNKLFDNYYLRGDSVTVKTNPNDYWEKLGKEVNVEKNKDYTLSVNIKLPDNYQARDGYEGLAILITDRQPAGGGNCSTIKIGDIIQVKDVKSCQIKLDFNSGEHEKVWVVVNFGYLKRGTEQTINFYNWRLTKNGDKENLLNSNLTDWVVTDAMHEDRISVNAGDILFDNLFEYVDENNIQKFIPKGDETYWHNFEKFNFAHRSDVYFDASGNSYFLFGEYGKDGSCFIDYNNRVFEYQNGVYKFNNSQVLPSLTTGYWNNGGIMPSLSFETAMTWQKRM